MRRDIIVIGASAGGIPPLIELISGFPANLAASVFVVVHIPADRPSALDRILGAAGELGASAPGETGEEIARGRLYLAQPGRHLLVTGRRVLSDGGPKAGIHRPSVDLLFASAAEAFGRRVIGIVLSGLLSDGSHGLREIKRRGGATLVQDPGEALFDAMPRSAIALRSPDFCPRSRLMATLVQTLMRG